MSVEVERLRVEVLFDVGVGVEVEADVAVAEYAVGVDAAARGRRRETTATIRMTRVLRVVAVVVLSRRSMSIPRLFVSPKGTMMPHDNLAVPVR